MKTGGMEGVRVSVGMKGGKKEGGEEWRRVRESERMARRAREEVEWREEE